MELLVFFNFVWIALIANLQAENVWFLEVNQLQTILFQPGPQTGHVPAADFQVEFFVCWQGKSVFIQCYSGFGLGLLGFFGGWKTKVEHGLQAF